MKNTTIQLKNSLTKFNGLKQAGQRNQQFQKCEIIKSKKQKDKRMKRSEQNLGT